MTNEQNIQPGDRAVFGSLGCGLSIFPIAAVDGEIITLENGERHHISVPREYRGPVTLNIPAAEGGAS